MKTATEAAQQEAFTGFVSEAEPRLRFALSAALGQERGREATAEALAYGWEHWERVGGMENPVGYLYRVGRSRVRRRPERANFSPVSTFTMPEVEPGLPEALSRLSEKQRIAVFLVYGFGWSRREVADMLSVSVNSVGTHLDRGLAKLRFRLGVAVDD